MESELAIAAFAALSQPTRLDAFRQLIAAEPAGLPAGELARRLAAPANTLSSHLNILSSAGLIRGRRQGRMIIYRAELDRLQALVGFLLTDCCGGRPDICEHMLNDLLCARKADCA